MESKRNQSVNVGEGEERKVGKRRRKKKKRRGGKWLLAISWSPNKHIETVTVSSQRALDLESKEHKFSLISDTYLMRYITFLNYTNVKNDHKRDYHSGVLWVIELLHIINVFHAYIIILLKSLWIQSLEQFSNYFI